MSNAMDPSALLATLPSLVQGAELSNQQDALSALTHTVLVSLGFRLLGTDDTESVSNAENLLENGWNKHGPGHYTFRYSHEQSSMKYLFKISKLGTRTIINAIALEADKISTLDISTNDFTSQSFFPHTLQSSPLVHGFISLNRVQDFVSQLMLKIIQNLVPGLHKGDLVVGSNETHTTSPRATSSQNVQPPFNRPRPEPDPSLIEQPYRLPFRTNTNPLEIGRRDLDPFPIRPFAPPSLFPDNEGDGMYVGPNHPILGGINNPGSRGPWGGDGFLPPLGAPPGARFDPIGPTLPRNPLRRGRGGFARSGDPDNDEFMPPGMGDMFS